MRHCTLCLPRKLTQIIPFVTNHTIVRIDRRAVICRGPDPATGTSGAPVAPDRQAPVLPRDPATPARVSERSLWAPLCGAFLLQHRREGCPFSCA